MRKKISIWILVLILLALPILAAPPFETIASAKGYTIEVPPIFYLKQGRSMQFHAHVFNSSGHFLTNESTGCILHLYNETGSYILQEEMGFDSNLLEWDRTINSSVMNFLGQGAFIVFCNSSDGKGGFLARNTMVTKTGTEEINDILPIVMTLIFIILIFILFGSWQSTYRNTKGERTRWGISIFSFGIALIELINLMFIIYLKESGGSLLGTLRINFYVLLWLGLGIGLLALILIVLRLLAPQDINDDKEDEPKWQK